MEVVEMGALASSWTHDLEEEIGAAAEALAFGVSVDAVDLERDVKKAVVKWVRKHLPKDGFIVEATQDEIKSLPFNAFSTPVTLSRLRSAEALEAKEPDPEREFLKVEYTKQCYHVAGIAYSGCKMRQFGWSLPLVVDMENLSIPEDVPLVGSYRDPSSAGMARLGLAHAKTAERHGLKALEMECDVPLSLYPWIEPTKPALSIDIEVEAAERVDEGFRVVNGGTHAAPFYLVTKATLRSIVARDA